MIDLEKIAYDIGVGKSQTLTRWMLPIATLEEMIALIRKQESALAAPAAPIVTVDTSDFQDILGQMQNEYWRPEQINAWHGRLIAHIDAHTQAAIAQARATALAELHPAYEATQMRAIDAEEKLAQASAPVAAMQPLTAEQVEWITNDNAELGVKIGNQFFFLYKGDSLVYENGLHDDGTRMQWRPVFKREFGECAHPINHADYSKIGTVNLADSDQWKPILAAPQQHAQSPDLTSVIHWLEGGCDPQRAAKELRGYQRRMGQQEAAVLPVQQNAQAALSDADMAIISDGLKVADVLIDMIPTRLQEHADDTIARIGELVNVKGGYNAIASAKRCFSKFADGQQPVATPVPLPEFSRDPDGDLALDWVVGDASLSVSFSAAGVVSWATGIDGASACGSQQVAQDSGRDAALKHAIEQQIYHCEMNDVHLPPELGDAEGQLAVPVAYLKAALSGMDRAQQGEKQ